MAVKFSILVVCLNPGAKLAETVESIRKQEYRDYEIIVKDGGSKDGSAGLLPADEKIRLIEKKDTGIYDAMNKGIRKATGEIIGIINSDDWYEPEAAKTAVTTFCETGCDLMYANIRMHKADGSTFIKKARSRRFQTSRDWNHPTTFVKAECYKTYPFRQLGIHDDYGFFLQMRKLGKKIVIVDKVLANFHMGGASNHKDLKAAGKRIMDRYRYCYRINGYSRWYLIECVAIEAAKYLLG